MPQIPVKADSQSNSKYTWQNNQLRRKGSGEDTIGRQCTYAHRRAGRTVLATSL